MRINVLSYLSAAGDPGGGGRYRRALLRAGRDRGHEITELHVLPRAHLSWRKRPDLWILIDIWNSPHHWNRIDRRILRWVPLSSQHRYRGALREALSARNSVHIDHAYVDVCDLDYLPCSGNTDGISCFHRPTPKGTTSGACFARVGRKLYEETSLSFFLSPLHRATVEGIVGDLASKARFLRPPVSPMVPSRAGHDSDGSDVRSIDKLFLGSFVEAKGSREIAETWPNGEVLVVGPETADALAYPNYAGQVAHGEVWSLLSKTKTLVLRPRWPEPFGLVVLEAAMAGCELDGNDRVGALSFGPGALTSELTDGAAEDFWGAVESIPEAR